MTNTKIYSMSVSSVYPLYIQKVTRKGRTQDELDKIIQWLTGYNQEQFERVLQDETSFQDFFDQAPALNPNRRLITGLICGVRVEEIKEPLIQEIRYLDKLVDELANGKGLEKILRQP